MAVSIAVAGKGGTGKTTFTALTIRELMSHGKSPILAVDADANANLHEALGMVVDETVADFISRVKNNLEPLPAGMTKDQFIEMRIFDSLVEGEDCDLLVMGGPEGAGCYCYANNVLKMFMDRLAQNYPYLIADNEAGLEHLSRRTTQNVDHLFVVSDASARGVRSARRIKELVQAIDLDVRKMYLVISRAVGPLDGLRGEIEKTGLELAGIIPDDPLVREYDLNGTPLVQLPGSSQAAVAVQQILKTTGIL